MKMRFAFTIALLCCGCSSSKSGDSAQNSGLNVPSGSGGSASQPIAGSGGAASAMPINPGTGTMQMGGAGGTLAGGMSMSGAGGSAPMADAGNNMQVADAGAG